MLFAALRSVRMVKNCDLGLENASCGLGQHFKPEVTVFHYTILPAGK